MEKIDFERYPKVLTRESFTNYVLCHTKFSFHMMVRILVICLKFVRALCQKWDKKKLNPASTPPH
jgi:hypothetical protein